MGDILILVLPIVIVWRVAHAEATAPDDPFLYALAALIVVARYVWRPIYARAAAWDKAHGG